ncbi:hypothetical protein Zm00014a_037389 [Zea mays]|uniref:Uncharacterized protein n=1 Tax=Zea mays TaxID=4577 RepID=A0A317Y6H4_MAIZE|nr:hypothetical protein Zm00014a_037389 [Zea mays]
MPLAPAPSLQLARAPCALRFLFLASDPLPHASSSPLGIHGVVGHLPCVERPLLPGARPSSAHVQPMLPRLWSSNNYETPFVSRPRCA